MAKTSGSNGGLPNGDSNYKGKVGKLEPLASIKNPKVYKSVPTLFIVDSFQVIKTDMGTI